MAADAKMPPEEGLVRAKNIVTQGLTAGAEVYVRHYRTDDWADGSGGGGAHLYQIVSIDQDYDAWQVGRNFALVTFNGRVTVNSGLTSIAFKSKAQARVVADAILKADWA